MIVNNSPSFKVRIEISAQLRTVVLRRSVTIQILRRKAIKCNIVMSFNKLSYSILLWPASLNAKRFRRLVSCYLEYVMPL